MRRSAFLGMFVLVAACGGGSGGSGGVLADGPAFWGIPFVPASGGREMVIGFKNLDGSGTTATITPYKSDGTIYGISLGVTLDAFDEHRVSMNATYGTAGGWIEVATPSRRVEVYFSVVDAGKAAEESSRASALPDLGAPPPLTTAGIASLFETGFIQVSNATALVNTITVTAFDEPADPLLPPVASTPPSIVLAPFATLLIAPDSLSGITGFVGSFDFSSPNPFFVASEEDLAFDVPHPQTQWETEVAALRFGREFFGGVLDDFIDFSMIVRNGTPDGQALTIQRITLSDGFDLKAAPRTIFLAPHETRVVSTTDPTISDIYGDVLTAFSLSRTSIQMLVPPGVDVQFRQFDPVSLSYDMTVHAVSIGHEFAAMDILPFDPLPSDVRTFETVINPNGVPITVIVEAHIPEPAGFDVTPLTLTTLTIPAFGHAEFSPDGVTYLDRDLVAAGFIGLHFQSGFSFGVSGYRETRSPAGPLVSLSPSPVRNYDDGD